MPEDRLFHKRLGHSLKVNQLTDAEEIVWRTYIQAADDFGVMRFDALPLQVAHERLANRSKKVVQRMLERVRDVGLIFVFEHQQQLYCYQLDWQDYQKVRYPLRTTQPRPPRDCITRATRATRWLFTAWPGGKKKLATWLPPDDFEPESGQSSGTASGTASGKVSGKPSEDYSGRSRASAPARGPVPDPGVQPRSLYPDPCTPIPGDVPVPEPEPVPHAICERGEEESTVERSAATPPSVREVISFPSPLSRQPAEDGNYAVIERIAHEVFDELRVSEPTPDVVERVKELCAKRHIAYGPIVRRAVESAATQRLLLPAAGARRNEPSSLASLVEDFRPKLEAMRARARELDRAN